jgi:hypothetical protein
MPALSLKADIPERRRHVGFAPQPDIEVIVRFAFTGVLEQSPERGPSDGWSFAPLPNARR